MLTRDHMKKFVFFKKYIRGPWYEHGYFKLPDTWGTFSKNTWYFLSICRIDMIRSALESWHLQENQKIFFLKKLTSLDLNHYVFPRYLRKSEAGKRSSTTQKLWILHPSSKGLKMCLCWGWVMTIFTFMKTLSIKLSDDVFSMVWFYLGQFLKHFL